MRLAFIDIAYAYTAQTPYDSPLGGTQSAACYLAAELVKRGAEVSLINLWRQPGTCHGVRNLPPEALDDDAAMQGFDAIILNGRWTEKMPRLLKQRTTAPLIAWMHEACFSTPFILPAPEFDAIIFVSNWQRKLNAARIPAHARQTVIPNGIASVLANFIPLPPGGVRGGTPVNTNDHPSASSSPPEPPTAIYAGSSKRGLLDLPAIIPALNRHHPDLHFAVYSDCLISADTNENERFKKILANLPNMGHVGAIPQKDLPGHLTRAQFFLSPNAYPETFCIALAEAMAAGLVCITTARAALPETGAGFTHLAPFADPDNPNWLRHSLDKDAFAAFAATAIQNWKETPENIRTEKRNAQMAFAASHYNWAKHAESWMGFLSELKQ